MPRIRQYAEKYATEDFLREMRSRMGYHALSQYGLAEKINVCQTTISNHMRDPNNIKVGELRSLNKVLGLNPRIVLALLGYTQKQITDATSK